MSLSPEQARAVRREGQDVCVIAGPGSGKTRVLIERYAWLIEERGVDAQRILAITFTEKAATEIKERLLKRFSGDAELRPKIERAWVSTIHGFCARLLREHAIAAGVAPDFTVLDAPAADELQRRSADHALESLYQRDRLAVSELLDAISAGTMADSDRVPDVARLLMEVYEALRIGGGEIVMQPAGSALPEIRRAIQEAASQTVDRTPAQRETQQHFRAWAREFLALPETLAEKHLTVLACHGVKRPKQGTRLHQIQPLLKNDWPAQLLQELRAPQRALVVQAIEGLQRTYADAKRSQGALDFNDLEERTIALLEGNAALRESLRERFEQVLVDELQDTNRLQWRLFDLLRAPGRFFAVGDVNQSIYGFRHAEPELLQAYRDRLAASGGEIDDLRDNYRSRPQILGAVQALLGRENGIEPRELQAKAAYPDAAEPCVEVLAASGHQAPQVEAALIAQRIRELAGTLLVGEREPRPAELRDMAILVRSFAAMEPITRALDAFGIPHVVNAGRTFLEARETRDLMLLLAAVANPRDQIALAGVMRSPLAGISDESVYRHFAKLPVTDPGDRDRYAAFFERLHRVRARRDRIPPDALLAEFVDASGYEEGLPPRARANVEKFLSLVASLHRQQARGPAELLEHLERLRASASEAEAPPSEAGNMVQVLTFHAAKGLEWPVVFVAALNRGADSRTPSILYQPDRGLGLRWRVGKSDSCGDPTWQAIREHQKARNAREENRLLYVAMTRAREKLVLSYAEAKRKQSIVERIAASGEAIQARVVTAAIAPDPAGRAFGCVAQAADAVIPRLKAVAATASKAAVTEVAGDFVFGGWRDREAARTGISVHAWIAAALNGQQPDPQSPAASLGRRFLDSDLGRRALQARRREVEFDFLYDEGGLLLRGQIDLWFEDDAGVCIVDYKTDQQLDGPALVRYTRQVTLYAAALAKYAGRPASEAWLFHLPRATPIRVDLRTPD